LQRRRQNVIAESSVDIDAQSALHDACRARRFDRCILDVGEVRRDLIVELPAFLGQRDRARRTVKQFYADALLQPRHGTADAGLGDAERFTGPHKAAGLNDGGQNPNSAEQSTVEGHFKADFLSS
jgi:hypothetical protein